MGIRTMSETMPGGSVFVQDLNPMSGKSCWSVRASDYDYQQEVARAGFADMLHDSERNHLYYEGLKSAISLLRSRGQEVHVLDIGTGTGLLAMMAARLGADTVVAVEEFAPMAGCAAKVMEDNGFKDKIKLVRKRSTGVEVGPGKDMERRANLLVTEVFDTELIGEGAIGTFNHAHKCLLTPDCLVVPTSGTMYAQVVSSSLAARWNSLHPILDASNKALVNTSVKNEANSSLSLALHDLQLTQMKREWFTPLTEPISIFSFDFSGKKGPIPINEQTVRTVEALSDGNCDAVFMWWDLWMDPQEKILLSCAPKWAHPAPENMAWRDHWMQAVYYPISKVKAQKGKNLSVISNHDEYSLWFDISKQETKSIGSIPMPNPTPGLHLAVSRTRLGQMNDQCRNNVLAKVLEKTIANGAKNILCLGELSLLPLMAARLGAEKVVAVERNTQMRASLKKLAENNGVKDKILLLGDNGDGISIESIVSSPSNLPFEIEAVIAEPNFALSILPWDNLRYWFCLDQLRQCINPIKTFSPVGAEIWAVPVEFLDLWKIRSPVGETEGFSITPFDDIIMGACDDSDAEVEPHPLWEYPCIARGKPEKLISFNFADPVPSNEIKTTANLGVEGKTNGVALWMVWDFGSGDVLSSGPTAEVEVGATIEWDLHSKQGVHIFVPSKPGEFKKCKTVSVGTIFDPVEADMDFTFKLHN